MKMTARIEEFRHELQVRVRFFVLWRSMTGPQETYPHLFEICPLTMRTRGILLVKDAILTMTLSLADGASLSPRC